MIHDDYRGCWQVARIFSLLALGRPLIGEGSIQGDQIGRDDVELVLFEALLRLIALYWRQDNCFSAFAWPVARVLRLTIVFDEPRFDLVYETRWCTTFLVILAAYNILFVF